MNPILCILMGIVAGLAIVAPIAFAWAKRTERRARESERRAREAEHLAYVGTMTGGLAHEIRNPLSTLNLNVQLLREDLDRPGTGADPAVLRKLGTLEQEIGRLQQILDAFLRFAGKLDVKRRPESLNRVVEELVEFYEARLDRSGVRLRVCLADNLPPVEIDPDLLKQALSNLLLNAEAAMPEGGELMITTEAARGEALVHVTDTGTGIAPEQLDKIFHPYYSTRKGGTGLGLPTVRRIVQEHAGRLEVHSEPGRGTRFTLRLPAADRAAREAPPTHA